MDCLHQLMGVSNGLKLWHVPPSHFISYLFDYNRLAKVDPVLCAQKLPSAFHTLVPHLCAEQDGVRFGTAQVGGGWDSVGMLMVEASENPPHLD